MENNYFGWRILLQLPMLYFPGLFLITVIPVYRSENYCKDFMEGPPSACIIVAIFQESNWQPT